MTMNDEFFNKYTPDETIISTEFDEDQTGMLETYGADLEAAIKIRNEKPKHIWSVVDGDNGDLLIIAGFHNVNCVYFLITLEPWEHEEEEYILGVDDNENLICDEVE